MKVAAVIPVGPGREANLMCVLNCLVGQTRRPDLIVVVEDGDALGGAQLGGEGEIPVPIVQVRAPKHMPGLEQPRNVGVRVAVERVEGLTHAWFVDSDVVVVEDALEQLETAVERGGPLRTVVAPYDWMPPGLRPEAMGPAFWGQAPQVRNDPRWEMFRRSPPETEYTADLSAGLACFSGNLLWHVQEFARVGGFWSEIHHGRCEDGELGLRAVAMGVSISFQAAARGFHLWHPVNHDLAVARNERDVPMLNERHPWVEGSDVFMVDRDGKAFDVRCDCGELIPTIDWWNHAPTCSGMPIPVVENPSKSTTSSTEGRSGLQS